MKGEVCYMKKVIELIKKNKIILLIGGSVVLLVILGLWLINSNDKKIMVDNLELEINSEVNIYSLISVADGVELITEDESIDTSKLGKHQITIKYLNSKKREKTYSFKINVVDTTAPNIESEKEIIVALGAELDFSNSVVVTDNSKEEIVPFVEGQYDLNAAGEYNLKFVAKDSSGNKSVKDFTLIVKSVEIKTNGYYVYKTSDTWYEVMFGKDGTFMYLPWFCPGSGCGGYSEGGTYTVKGNKIYATVTYEIPDIGDKIELMKLRLKSSRHPMSVSSVPR